MSVLKMETSTGHYLLVVKNMLQKLVVAKNSQIIYGRILEDTVYMYERQNVPLNFLVQRMRIIILKKTESTTGISASLL